MFENNKKDICKYIEIDGKLDANDGTDTGKATDSILTL